MNTSMIKTFDVESCRSALASFWSEISDIRCHDKGIAFSLPILLADGWQVTLYAEEEVSGYITLRDRGKMSSWLYVRGVNVKSGGNRSLVDQLMADYGISVDESGFYKTLRLPLAASELQLFACFLSSVSHLVNRVQKQSIARYVAYSSVIDVATRISSTYKTKLAYKTPHRTITVELSLFGQNQHTVLVQTFDQRDSHVATDAMELWSSRLPEIAATKPNFFSTALIYNEDVCNISSDVISVARSRRNFVCPSHKQDEITDFLSSCMVG